MQRSGRKPFWKLKKGFELSLHAVVDLVLAAMALVVVMLIISSVLFGLYSEKESAQDSGFMNIVSAIERNEEAGVETTMKPAIGYLKEGFAIVGFSKGVDNFSEEYDNENVEDSVFSLGNVRAWFGQEFKLMVDRPDKCKDSNNNSIACLCLCKLQKGKKGYSVRANCVQGMCYPFRENENLKFKGGVNENIPIIYRNNDDLYNYCLKWENDYIKFQPHKCEV